MEHLRLQNDLNALRLPRRGEYFDRTSTEKEDDPNIEESFITIFLVDHLETAFCQPDLQRL